MSKLKVISAVGVVATVAIVALVVALRRDESSVPAGTTGSVLPMSERKDVAAQRPAPPPGFKPWDESRLHRTVSNLVNDQAERLDLGPQAAARLAATAGETISAYWTADVDRFVDLQESQGLVPRSTLTGSNAKERMASLTRSLSGSPIDFDRVAIALYARNGEILISEDPYAVAKGIAVPRGENDIVDPVAAGADVVTIRVPAYTLSDDGRSFESELVLYFVERPGDGEWLLIRIDSKNPNATRSSDDPRIILPPL